MTEHTDRRGRRYPARTRLLTPLLLATCLGIAVPSHASENTVLYIQPVLSRGPVTYSIGLYSSVEFPMRDEVATLSIGGKSFINSSYVQGGDLHTIIFSLTQSQFQSLKNGDQMVVYYGQSDASDPAAQWVFGTFQGVTRSTITKTIGTIQTISTPIQVIGAPISDVLVPSVTKAGRVKKVTPTNTKKTPTATKGSHQ